MTQNFKKMKKVAIIVAFILSAVITIAQEGSFYIGGVAGYSSSTTKDPDNSDSKTVTSTWAAGPEFGTFLTDDIQLGLALGLSGDARKMGDEKDYSKTSFVPTLYGRNFFRITDNFSTFAGLYLAYFSMSQTNYNYDSGSEVKTKYKENGFGARLGIGVSYALSPKFTILGQYGLLGFYTTTTKDGDGNKLSKDSGFDFGVNTVGSDVLSQGNGSGAVFNIGIYYTIGD